MRPLRGAVWVCAFALLATTAAPVHAAWCNVFQVCCFPRLHRSSASVSYYAPPASVSYNASAPCCDPCPQPVCTTRYVQRCYYQPVTSYQTRSFYEPVTTYQTSYYYEPVASYRYSCYYDPCTCSYQQVACPTTSYRLRSQTCPVQSWVQRCASVPVRTYQQSFYWEPVTTCCAPATAPLLPAQDCAPATTAPIPTQPPPAGGPGVTEIPNRNGSDALRYNRYYPLPDPMPPAAGSSYRQLPPNGTAPLRQAVPASPPPGVKLDRIVAAPLAQIQGQVVRKDKIPWAGAQMLFVSADRLVPRQMVAADETGKFKVTLGSGGWLVYVQGVDGKPTFQRKIEVHENQPRQVNLVSR